MVVPVAQPSTAPAPAVAQIGVPLAAPESSPVKAPEAPAPAPVVAQAPAPVVVPAPAPAVIPAPAPVIARASVPVQTPAAAPAQAAAQPQLAVLSPPSLAGVGKLQLGMAMTDAMHTFHSFGEADRDEFGAETQTFLISDGHGYVVLLTEKGKPQTLYGIEYHGGADADTAPTIMGVRLG